MTSLPVILFLTVGLAFCLQDGWWWVWFQIAQKHVKKSGVTPSHLGYHTPRNDITSFDATFDTVHKRYQGAQEVQMHMTQKVGPEYCRIREQSHTQLLQPLYTDRLRIRSVQNENECQTHYTSLCVHTHSAAHSASFTISHDILQGHNSEGNV